MTTVFAALQSLCGISNREAAEYLGIAEKTVEKFRTGRSRCAAPGHLRELQQLWTVIDTAAVDRAEDILRAMSLARADTIEIGYPADDAEARELGLPCTGAWRQMLARTLDELMLADEGLDLARIRLVPRGTTPATALAIDDRVGPP